MLTYLVVIMGFYFSGYKEVDSMGIGRFDTLTVSQETFRTIGRGRSGRTY